MLEPPRVVILSERSVQITELLIHGGENIESAIVIFRKKKLKTLLRKAGTVVAQDQ